MVCIGLIISSVVTHNSSLQTHYNIRVVSMILTTVHVFEQATCDNRLALEARGASKLNLIELEVRETSTGNPG